MRAAFVSIALLSLLVSGLAVAQDSEAPGEPAAGSGTPSREQLAESFSEQIEVEVINVDVWVTDGDGRPVAGLSREDFRLYEDGEPVEITHFGGLQGVGGAAAAPEPEGEPAPWAAPDEASVPIARDARPLHLAIFVDDLQLRPNARARVLGSIEELLDREIPTATPIMLAVHTGSGVLMEDFTTDRDELRRSLDRFDRLSASGIQVATERARVFSEIYEQYKTTERVVERLTGRTIGDGTDGNAAVGKDVSGVAEPCTDNWASFTALVSQHAHSITDRAERSVRAMAAVAQALSGVEGRKAVVYVGGGLERQPAYDLFQYLGEVCPHRQTDVLTTAQRFDLTPVYDQLTAIANDAGAVFYVLEAEGGAVESNNQLQEVRFRPSAQIAQIHRQNTQDGLFQIADQTGGRAIFDVARFDRPLEGLARDLEAYYSLGFAPASPGDGERHRLRVEVEGDYRVRHRESYRAKPYEQLLAERVMAVLQAGAEQNDLGARVQAGEAESLGGGLFRVPLEVRVPLERLTLLTENGGRSGRLRVILWVADDGGGVRPLRQKMVPVEIPGVETGEETPAGDQLVEVGIEVPRGEHRVAIGLRDEVGGEEAYLGLSFQVDPSPWQTANTLKDDR